METQAKLLNKDYLETRLRDLSVIRKKEEPIEEMKLETQNIGLKRNL
jgi:hypothetical protein